MFQYIYYYFRSVRSFKGGEASGTSVRSFEGGEASGMLKTAHDWEIGKAIISFGT